MALLTYRQAAATVGVSRSTLYRKVAEGALSATTLPDGTKAVDTSELIRVFGELKPKPTDTTRDSTATVAPLTPATVSNTLETALLKTQLELLRDQLEQAREREGRLLALLEEEQRSRRELEIRRLPPPRQGLIERIVEAMARLRRPKGTS
jgi:excisionase family DNA binding protein